MGKAKKTRKFAQVKRVIGQRDARLKQNQDKGAKESQKPKGDDVVREIPQYPTSLFFTHNTALCPPYPVLLDTNFLSHAIHHKLDLLPSLMDCLLSTVRVIITDCVMGELEKLGPKYRLALRTARDERWERLTCGHKGVYADDCLVDRVVKHRIYLVGTNDRDLRRRIRKVPGVPLIGVKRGGMYVEKLPDAPET